jgi:Holliday junction DNA helicase RuvA
LFEYINGILKESSPESAILDVGGIGYRIQIPLSTYDSLPDIGKSVKLLTHYYVREDSQKLYGFKTGEEREVFRQLLGISKIGPKVAINVLSGLSVKDIVYSVQTSDASRLKAISGIGAKTAQRLVMELKGRLDIQVTDTSIPQRKPTEKLNSFYASKKDAHTAMISLGYNENQVTNALIRVEQTIEKDAPVEMWIKKALQVI